MRRAREGRLDWSTTYVHLFLQHGKEFKGKHKNRYKEKKNNKKALQQKKTEREPKREVSVEGRGVLILSRKSL